MTDHDYFPIRSIDVAAIVTFWAFLSLVSALGRQLDPRVPDVARSVVAATVTATYVEYALWAALTIPIWWLASRYSIERGHRAERIIAFVACGMLVAIVMDLLLRHVRDSFFPPFVRERLHRRLLPPPTIGGLAFLDDFMVYFAVLGTGIARDYLLRYRTRLRETVQLQAQLTQARLDALRTQLNPHFLFNTLNSVSALVERDPRGARRMIARLSDLLRHTLEEGNEQEVRLERELDLLDEYIDLMQIRFQDRLEVRMDVSADARVAYVPNLVLQPIVENALKHGVAAQTDVGRIVIRAVREGEVLCISVTDNGPGPAGGSRGVGLTNTSARLRQLYGLGADLVLARANGGGAEARLTLPYHTTPLPRASSAGALHA